MALFPIIFRPLLTPKWSIKIQTWYKTTKGCSSPYSCVSLWCVVRYAVSCLHPKVATWASRSAMSWTEGMRKMNGDTVQCSLALSLTIKAGICWALPNTLNMCETAALFCYHGGRLGAGYWCCKSGKNTISGFEAMLLGKFLVRHISQCFRFVRRSIKHLLLINGTCD